MNTVPLVGEPLALDLVNTRAHTPEGELDLLDDEAGFQAWIDAERGRLTPPHAPIELGALRSLRAHVSDAVEHARVGTPPPPAALAAIGEAQRAAPAHRELVWADGAVIASVRRPGDATARLLAELAEAAAELLTDPAIGKVHRCEGPDCRLLFLPAHPRRRWCSPARCGNRVRVARYYQRHRDSAS
ncbi:putative RNA-binding Zn ribbon-like protein [Streptacidiphilus sp. MAP12-20]|uniref:CGNR zinc finger domain-containing protein n=1 Tax=Streptacidiphilus sp. MAP12-20 TaxID=3156299 RepID=UPI0035161590